MFQLHNGTVDRARGRTWNLNTQSSPVLFIQLCHDLHCLGFSVCSLLCNFPSQQRNSSCRLHACGHELIAALLNICYLRSHMVKGKGRKRPSSSPLDTLTYCACRHSGCVCHLQDFVLGDCELFFFSPFAPLKTAGHVLPV